MSTDTDTSLPGAEVADRFLQLLSVHRLDQIPLLFEPDADLRALLPGGLLVGEGADDVRDMFAEWFGDVDEYEVADAGTGTIGSRLYLRWKVRLRADRFGKRPKLVEQHAYADLGPTGLIRTMSLVCSGYCREALDD